MPYPESPFQEIFESELITHSSEKKCGTTISNEELQKILKWLCSFPKISSYRVNTLKCIPKDVLDLINKYCEEELDKQPKVEIHPSLSNVIIIIHSDPNESIIEKHENEVIIDTDCASAVLRGAHIYAPGVIGMLSGSQLNDKVSIYADTLKKCKKGLQKKFEEQKIFIGNGIVKMRRHQLFGENVIPTGIAVQVTETISGCPPLKDDFIPSGWALLQNLPSVLCVLALNPKPNEIVIDMCASPGNKTTHIAELMQNTGLLVAIDKTAKKVTQLENRCEEFDAKVQIYEADSRNIVTPTNLFTRKRVTDGPPFSPESFDRVLLDAPCSVLGKRPQIVNRLSKNEIKSYVPLQRKLFETAKRKIII
ncbi:tRNA (cytosine(72)-C(5))-methyltransferase NSUN6 isoform X2 [Leptinotarsa decemlineata]|uniref:tRNA (cytosine(72)-C(5))-methyltransferase NSUN6 isoform X2 n=1 Tax=Leptinotarsa decemlineata TaxID=7539 RepID=UPI003D30C165